MKYVKQYECVPLDRFWLSAGGVTTMNTVSRNSAPMYVYFGKFVTYLAIKWILVVVSRLEGGRLRSLSLYTWVPRNYILSSKRYSKSHNLTHTTVGSQSTYSRIVSPSIRLERV